MSKAEHFIRRALQDIAILLERTLAEIDGMPVPGSALDQAGLADGVRIVEDYLDHNETGIALEHLIYMVEEPQLPISSATFHLIESAVLDLGMKPDLIERIRQLPE